MAVITKVSPSIDPMSAQFAQQITGLFAGEALGLCDVCYIKSADGLVYKSDATAAAEAAEFHGISARAVAAGEPVTLFGPGTRLRYGSGLTPGNTVFVGVVADAAGSMNTVAQVGDQNGFGLVITATDIQILRYLDAGLIASIAAALAS